MYNHIMVPLDGSELAECVLGHVIDIADRNDKPVVSLVRVVTPLVLTGSEYAGMISPAQFQKIEDMDMATAGQYLAKKAEQFQRNGINVKTAVLFGNVVDGLDTYAEKNKVDLIVIATHGRSGMSRFVWGSVADRILRTSKIPILMVRPDSCKVPPLA
jgi:nucleotide-binding universal stress UspA family protein